MAEPIKIRETPFVNEFRLNARDWTLVFILVLLIAGLTPALWRHLERFDTGPDYRIPYQLSRDYWVYQRRISQHTQPSQVVALGDSVVWGEYVLPNGTLSHFLNQAAGQSNLFVNGGVNGLFPLAMEGLVHYYGQALHGRKIILHCNLLWMSSPKADLQTQREEKFNHAALVPQFSPRIPCYKADANDRLSVLVQRNLQFVSWVDHLQNAYFDEKSLPRWTLQDDGTDPPHYPNSYKNPLAQITLALPSVSKDDSNRGPQSSRHKPWTSSSQGAVQFEWVTPESSLQWAAFQRLVGLLRERRNDVIVVLGPFNEHLIAPESKPAYQKLRDTIAAWLAENQIPHLAPELLPSQLYADASHPLTEGYEKLAKDLFQNPAFQQWYQQKSSSP